MGESSGGMNRRVIDQIKKIEKNVKEWETHGKYYKIFTKRALTQLFKRNFIVLTITSRKFSHLRLN